MRPIEAPSMVPSRSDEPAIRVGRRTGATCSELRLRPGQRRRAASFCAWSSKLGPVKVQPWLRQAANPQEEIVLSSGEPLTKKLKGQVSRARELGCWACWAIDRRGSPDRKFGANLPSPGTIAGAVEQAEVATESSFDVCAAGRRRRRSSLDSPLTCPCPVWEHQWALRPRR